MQRGGGVTAPEAYAFRAVRNAAMDLHRSRERRSRLLDGYATLEREPVAGNGGAHAARIFGLLNRIPESQREVILLRTRSDLTLAQVGAALERPEGTVAAQYARGLERLRELASESEVCL